jgi:hypothetical protein
VTAADSDYLIRLASLSLSFVGFSSVVVTLRGALGGELSERHVRLVRLYIEGGFLVTALALCRRCSACSASRRRSRGRWRARSRR